MQVFSKDQVRHRDRQYGASEAGIMAVCLRKGETVELGQSCDQRDGGENTYGDARKEWKMMKGLCCI